MPVGDWLGPIVVPLMGLLRWVHGHLGNWGWSIVALTVLINLAMAPLRHYSVANGIKMAKLGPEMRQIQDRYRKVPLMDPRRQQMQDEMAALYARHGMNMGSQMMVGCLPLLLTMPFLFAFYRVLTVSVELRGATFLWIADLAQKDPLFVTPGADGRLDVRDAADDADDAGPGAAADHDADAADARRHVPVGARRAQPLLADVEPVVDPAAERLAAAPAAGARAGRAGEEAAMKDRVFSGVDIDDALAIAAANLGLPKAELRYVVLDAGSAGGRGLKPTPARIAVLLEEARPEGGRGPRPPGRPAAAATAAAPSRPPRRPRRARSGRVAEAGGLDVAAELEDADEALLVRLRGQGPRVLPGARRQGRGAAGDRAPAAAALRRRSSSRGARAAHRRGLPRAAGRGARAPRRGAWPREVRADGRARTMPRLNAYERRVVHVALPEEPGITTSSAGEGAERRLTVAPAPAPARA